MEQIKTDLGINQKDKCQKGRDCILISFQIPRIKNDYFHFTAPLL